MASKRLKRITNEIKELENSVEIFKQSGIYYHYNEENINNIYAMLMGPEDTPYEKGFYFFKLEYPKNYPMEPPIVTYHTQGLLKNMSTKNTYSVRFNPNLYTCGKVCLSMLNTWSGPGWVPTNTISNVLVALQALVLNEEPLRNEPGFEHSDRKIIEKYNEVIEYANIKIAVLGIIENTPNEFIYFKEKMNELFISNIDFYKKFIEKKRKSEDIYYIESPAYGMSLFVDYNYLLSEIDNFKNKLENKI
jgi:hypothetical protein